MPNITSIASSISITLNGGIAEASLHHACATASSGSGFSRLDLITVQHFVAADLVRPGFLRKTARWRPRRSAGIGLAGAASQDRNLARKPRKAHEQDAAVLFVEQLPIELEAAPGPMRKTASSGCSAGSRWALIRPGARRSGRALRPVVRACLQPGDGVGVAASAGQHDDRRLQPCSRIRRQTSRPSRSAEASRSPGARSGA